MPSYSKFFFVAITCLVIMLVFPASYLCSLDFFSSVNQKSEKQEVSQSNEQQDFIDEATIEHVLYSEEKKTSQASILANDFYWFAGKVLVSSILYNILLSQCTARVCPEYFGSPVISRYHKLLKVFGLNGTDNATLLGFLGGLFDALLPGLTISSIAALSARFGNLPKVEFSDVVKEVMISFGGISVIAFAAGLIGFIWHSVSTDQELILQMSRHMPAEKIPNFYSCSYAHVAALVASAIAGIFLVYTIFKKRLEKHENNYKKACLSIMKSYQKMFDGMTLGHEKKLMEQERAFRQTTKYLRTIFPQL